MRPAHMGGAAGGGATTRAASTGTKESPGSFVTVPGACSPGRLAGRKLCANAQVAARAQRASVEPAEVARYEEYDRRHGARYLAPGGDAAAMDEEEW